MFLRLTQIISGGSHQDVWIQARHIVAVYPEMKGNGCSIALVTDINPEEPILHVAQLAEQVCQSLGPWISFPLPPNQATAHTK